MKKLEDAINAIMCRAEASGGLGSSPTANKIIEAVKPYYQKGSEQDKAYIIAKIEKLKKEPGIEFQSNYLQKLES
ncbi:hypothetical protein [Serratia marcescens]|uniref:hypothetical protein n=1 Tax=Serratia marcescens TaxID=615 RepID=UPI003EE171A7